MSKVKTKRENTLDIMRIVFKTVKEQYNNSGIVCDYIKDSENAYTVAIYQAKTMDYLNMILEQMIKHISQLQTDLALHNWRKQGLL